MKENKLIKLLAIVLLIGFLGCDAEKESESTTDTPRIKKYSKIALPKSDATFHLGDSVPFDIESEATIDSVQMEYEGEIETFQSGEFTWNAQNAKTGVQKLKLTVYSDEGSETHYPRVKFLSDKAPEQLTYRIVRTLPHDRSAYTQGLFFKEDTLFESTGPYLEYNGPKVQSRIKKVDLNTGEAYEVTPIETQYFGEGSTNWRDKIFMLTWTSQIGFVFDENLNQVDNFRYTHEGWGMTTKGDTLIVSDGTETLHLIDPRDFSEIGKLQVYTNKSKVLNINELEMIDGLLYANIYQEEQIAVIDPNTGEVLREIAMGGLLSEADAENTDVLNGIAHNPLNGKTYVTGKLWPKLFEVEFVPSN